MPRTVTYSPAYTIVPTYECFNQCSYCNFRTDPGQDEWLSLAAASDRLRALQKTDVIEILMLSGEVHPDSPRRSAWFEHIYRLCQLACEFGFLPHTNAGPLRFEEMARLKTVNVSLGLMLEQITPRLLATVHQHAPSKVPAKRLQQLAWAGELGIPFTTGILLGIGETIAERRESLRAIAAIHDRWGHIQEVILQPHRTGQAQSWAGVTLEPAEFLATIGEARQILPPSITLQVPPNLLPDPAFLLACLEAGARDLGGIGPKDEVNPDYPHLPIPVLHTHLAAAGWQLVPRLPVYPQYVTPTCTSAGRDDAGKASRTWISPWLRDQVAQWQRYLGDRGPNPPSHPDRPTGQTAMPPHPSIGIK
ncbi:7,8-didemethyl-8-hydroxy-5-deazariboflavin synthase subunit CofG [Trichothermofontia sp.]